MRTRLRAVSLISVLFFILYSFFIVTFRIYASDAPVTVVSLETPITGEIILPREIYLIPQTIFVGDRGRLVANLGPAFEGIGAFVLQSPEALSSIQGLIIKELIISRIELEKRNNNTRLFIDFVSYIPGSFTLPLLRLQSGGSKPLVLGGLNISVASILTPDIMVLSDPALPLAVPGMGFMVYGAMGILLILSIGIGGLFWTRRYFGPLREKLKYRKLRVSLEKRLKQLRVEENVLRQKELFSLLAGEFREFLSFLTGVNCSVLTPLEFLGLSLQIPGSPEPDYLYKLFRHWDHLRFSGTPLAKAEVFVVLDELGSFLTGLNNAEKKP